MCFTISAFYQDMQLSNPGHPTRHPLFFGNIPGKTFIPKGSLLNLYKPLVYLLLINLYISLPMVFVDMHLINQILTFSSI